MSTAIIRFENDSDRMVYCKNDSYPAGLGFDLLNDANIVNNKERFECVSEIPKDIEYEYIIQNDGDVHCQECWWASDKSYHGGGFRHGGTYNLKEWKEKIRLQNEYSYRNPKYWY